LFSAGSDNESKITKESGATTPKRSTKPEEKLISMTPEKIETPPQQTWTKVNVSSKIILVFIRSLKKFP
jgi:hypothetical protein